MQRLRILLFHAVYALKRVSLLKRPFDVLQISFSFALEDSKSETSLNAERAYKRVGHAPFEHFVRFLKDQFKWRMPS